MILVGIVEGNDNYRQYLYLVKPLDGADFTYARFPFISYS
jgi:hypothetical protein